MSGKQVQLHEEVMEDENYGNYSNQNTLMPQYSRNSGGYNQNRSFQNNYPYVNQNRGFQQQRQNYNQNQRNMVHQQNRNFNQVNNVNTNGFNQSRRLDANSGKSKLNYLLQQRKFYKLLHSTIFSVKFPLSINVYDNDPKETDKGNMFLNLKDKETINNFFFAKMKSGGGVNGLALNDNFSQKFTSLKSYGDYKFMKPKLETFYALIEMDIFMQLKNKLFDFFSQLSSVNEKDVKVLYKGKVKYVLISKSKDKIISICKKPYLQNLYFLPEDGMYFDMNEINKFKSGSVGKLELCKICVSYFENLSN